MQMDQPKINTDLTETWDDLNCNISVSYCATSFEIPTISICSQWKKERTKNSLQYLISESRSNTFFSYSVFPIHWSVKFQEQMSNFCLWIKFSRMLRHG